MPRPDPREIATPESRSKGGKARAASLADARKEARERAIEQLAGMTDKALARLESLLVADGDADAYRAVREVLDRVLGRPTQEIAHTADITGDITVEHRGVKLSDILTAAREAGLAD